METFPIQHSQIVQAPSLPSSLMTIGGLITQVNASVDIKPIVTVTLPSSSSAFQARSPFYSAAAVVHKLDPESICSPTEMFTGLNQIGRAHV